MTTVRLPGNRHEEEFNDDMIMRTGLSEDVRSLIHDLCYDHAGRDRELYKIRAQAIMKRDRHG